jgi:hypothetical protein
LPENGINIPVRVEIATSNTIAAAAIVPTRTTVRKRSYSTSSFLRTVRVSTREPQKRHTVSPLASGFPHLPQNFAVSFSQKRQVVSPLASGFPHLPQNFTAPLSQKRQVVSPLASGLPHLPQKRSGFIGLLTNFSALGKTVSEDFPLS